MRLWTVEHANVVQGVGVENDEVGDSARCNNPKLALAPDEFG